MVSIIIPTYNAGKCLANLLQKICRMDFKSQYEIVIIDSSSTDNTIEIAKDYNTQTIVIPKNEFDHGSTRKKAGMTAKGDVLVYITQDITPVKNSIPLLIEAFEDEDVAIAYGRQLPYDDATPFSRHLRYFNYPDVSCVKSIEDKDKYGMKTVFNSDSFSAYRRKVLEEINWFPENALTGEDVYAAGKALLKGYKIAYAANACVFHSHNLGLKQLFKRYFNIGSFYHKENWIRENFGKTQKEGKKFIKSEIFFLRKNGFSYLIPFAFFRNITKWTAYNLGGIQNFIPLFLKRRLSLAPDIGRKIND